MRRLIDSILHYWNDDPVMFLMGLSVFGVISGLAVLIYVATIGAIVQAVMGVM